MPVNKNDHAILRKNRVAYEVVPRDLCQQIENPVALAIWIYLLTKPENWVVRKNEIMDHFSLGRDRYGEAMKLLKDLGLIVYAKLTDPETGHLQGQVIWVNGSTEIPVFRHAGKPDSRENRTLKDNQIKLKKQISHIGGGGNDWVLPDFVNPEAWQEFEQHRREIRKPLSNMARTKAANQLRGLTAAQQAKCVDMTIQNAWRGLFPEKVKNETSRPNGSNHKSAADRAEEFHQACVEYANGDTGGMDSGAIFETSSKVREQVVEFLPRTAGKNRNG